jgi:Phage integrase, N-terminal SAM-like domain
MGGKRSFGTVRQLRSGRWQARYTGPDGLVRPAPHTFERRRDAEVWLAKTHADIARDDWMDPDGGWIPLQEYATGWVRDHALGARTRERYEDLLRLHIDPYIGGRPLVSIKEANVRQWRQELLGLGVGPPTVAKSYRLLRAIMDTAVDELLIRRNPCRIKGAGEDRSPTRPILTIPQVYAVADSVPRGRRADPRGDVLQPPVRWVGGPAALGRRPERRQPGRDVVAVGAPRRRARPQRAQD